MSAAFSERDIAAEMQFHPGASREAAWREAERALAVRRALLAEAERRGLAADGDAGMVREAEEDARIRRLVEEAVAVPDVSEEECRVEYARHPERYRSPDLYEAGHILVAADIKDGDAREAARAKAEGLIEILLKSPERFGALAREISDCPSKSSGGALGQVTRRDIAPEIASMLAAMEPGTICSVPVPSRHAYHVLRLDNKSEGRVLPYEAVEGRVREGLRARAWAAAAREFIAGLVGEGVS
jgi:peptidyl-prolyl cis-trans isomerase C